MTYIMTEYRGRDRDSELSDTVKKIAPALGESGEPSDPGPFTLVFTPVVAGIIFYLFVHQWS